MELKHLIAVLACSMVAWPVAALEQKCIEINAPLLKVFDGALNIAPIMVTTNKLRHIQNGEGPEKVGLMSYGNQRVSVKQMLSVNDDLHAKQTLDQTLGMIKEIYKKYSSDLSKNKHYIIGILQQWASQRNVNDSIVLRWGSVSDDVFFKHELNTFQKIDQFIDEFALFVRDIKCTCKKSSKIFDDFIQKRIASGAKKEL